MKRYNPREVEPKWQAKWEEEKSYVVSDDSTKQKFYQLVEFPYPSGAGLHVGHTRPYVTFDVMARWRRLNGENVLYPIGWDSFGLPAEQYALKTGVHPAKTTADNINTFRSQAKRLGLSFDWSREYSTADPKAYKWTQWIFLNMFKHGLAYQAESLVWWCEELKSVLADEEVIDGKSERGGFPCERRPLRQWMLAITKYADRLYDDLDDVDYIEPVKISQRNWIGKSRGAHIRFKFADQDVSVDVFTTRPDTLFGATYLVLAPEHPLVPQITTEEHRDEVNSYIEETSKKSDLTRQEDVKDKTGAFTGSFVINPLTKEKVPVWISDYVLMGYGTGAIMAVPAHDERDFDFATKFKLPIVRVVKNDAPDEECTYDEGTMINSGPYNGMASEEAREKIVKDLSEKELAKEITNYKLRDWVFSRQRYWGEPFPIVWVSEEVYYKTGDKLKEWLPKEKVTKEVEGKSLYALPVLPEYLPVILPDVEDFKPQGLGRGPLALATDWNEVWINVSDGRTVSRKEPKPSEGEWHEGLRETDTMPNWAGSSWYFLRYLDPNNENEIASQAKIQKWMPVDWYNGGMEHTTLHLLYSRFWHKFLFDIGIVNTPEPYLKRTSHGLVLAEDGRKMSKSWGNVVDPLEVVESYGADTLRLYICFIGPFDQAVAWNTNGVAGSRRFVERFWTLTQEFIAANPNRETGDKIQELDTAISRAIKRVTTDIPRLNFNTAVAALMETVNTLYKLKEEYKFSNYGKPWQGALNQLVIISSPFLPHFCEELWIDLGNKSSVLNQEWPRWNEEDLITDEITVVVQVNGKVRQELYVNRDINQDDIMAKIKEDGKLKPYIEGKEIVKTIYIPNKLVNLVVK